ncbi:MAG: ABC transporter ATP-binding protein, partial [Firmicutes bacterium]|nr:ABC transporter ATP-binding protein [Bacillota bacterium]
MENRELLNVKNLAVNFDTEQGTVYAVRNIDFQVREGEILGIVGESGSGKSVSMYSVMGLLAENGHITADAIDFDGSSVLASSYSGKKAYEKMMQKVRGNTMSMIFQDPMTFLNPTLTIGRQLMEPLTNHTDLKGEALKKRAIELMTMVGIPSPETRLNQYPFEFSGGMRQRIIIAMALANSPKMIIADEPTTALDVTIQAQVLEL